MHFLVGLSQFSEFVDTFNDFGFMSVSCHFNRASNAEIGVECQMFVFVILFNCGRVLQFGAHSRYYKGALTQKRSFLVLCTTFRSDFHVGWKNQNKHSTLNSSFDALSKWHEPDIIFKIFWFLQTPWLRSHCYFCNLLNFPTKCWESISGGSEYWVLNKASVLSKIQTFLNSIVFT